MLPMAPSFPAAEARLLLPCRPCRPMHRGQPQFLVREGAIEKKERAKGERGKQPRQSARSPPSGQRSVLGRNEATGAPPTPPLDFYHRKRRWREGNREAALVGKARAKEAAAGRMVSFSSFFVLFILFVVLVVDNVCHPLWPRKEGLVVRRMCLTETKMEVAVSL